MIRLPMHSLKPSSEFETDCDSEIERLLTLILSLKQTVILRQALIRTGHLMIDSETDALSDADSELDTDCDSEIDSLTDADSELETDCDSDTEALPDLTLN